MRVQPASDTQTLPAPDTLARENFDMVVRRLADDLALGTDSSLFMGGGLEYAGSRAYEPGDSVRAIHWRLTARMGRAFVRQYEALKRTCVYIVVDTSASMAVSSTAISKHDLGVWVAASIGLVAQRRMSPTAVIGAGARGGEMPASLSRTDLWAGVEPLRRRDYAEGTSLAATLERVAGRAVKRSLIAVVSDLHDPGAVRAIRRAAQRHDCMVLHTLDPIEVEGARAGFVRAQEAETGRVWFLSRRGGDTDDGTLRSQLLRCGADYARLRTDMPFVPVLRRFLTTRGAASRGRG